MKEKLFCITTPTDRTYYRATPLAKEFLDKANNVVNVTGQLPDGEITEIAASSVTIKHFENGKLNGKLEMINLADGNVSFSEEYKDGMLVSVKGEQENTTAAKVEKAAPLYPGTTLKTSKGTHSFYINGKEVAEETISSNGVTLELLGNIPDGEVKEFNEAGQVITQANYKHNKLNGELVRFFPDGKICSQEQYVNGLLHGPAMYITLTKNGPLTAKCTYKNSRLDGERTIYQENGTLRKREFYTNGRLSGPRLSYYPNGNKEREENYTDGKLSGKREFYFPEGGVWFRENYLNGRLDGERVGFFVNGKPRLEEFYADGVLEGHRNLYAENGDLLSSEEYHWGTLVHNTERRA